MELREASLVLYKNQPARVKRVGAKLEIELEGGKTLSVRPKDVALLHPGPLLSLSELQVQEGEVETAWEILAGETVSLSDLAELAYEIDTPATAWAAWQLVAAGLYFYGTPQAVIARLPEDVERERAVRAAKAAEKDRWEIFLQQVSEGREISADVPYIQDVEGVAFGRAQRSRVLRELGRAERPETAHALLLELGRWDHTVNPYPQRLRLDISPPAVTLPKLLDEDRVDLTHLPAFAIDDEGTKDPDDALSLKGGRLWVHVADVAALVHPESAPDLEARARGANLYLPEETVPMLPAEATQALGLGLAEVSAALSFGLDLAADGAVADVEVVPSWVRVTRLTYTEVETRIGEEPFQSLHRLAQIHEACRQAGGAVALELPEVKIRVADGKVIIQPLLPLKSRALVMEAMLMVGGAVARYAVEREIPFPFSTQDPPDYGVLTQPVGLSGMYALRRALKRSQMSSVPNPHAGLGMTEYARVTSPLRRYLDLVAHQQLRAYLRGEEVLGSQQLLERVGAAEAVTGSVRQAERLARQHWTLVYLLEHPGWRGEGVLVDKFGSQGTVLIPELDLEPRVHMRDDVPLDSVVPLVLTAVNLPELEAHFQVAR